MPLVTVLLVIRSAAFLDHVEANLRRQAHARIDPLLIVDPLYADEATQAVQRWAAPPRIVVSNARSTLADRLNIGIRHAHGEMVAVFEETYAYGPYHVTDLVHALNYSGAHVVGKASWFEYDPSTDTFAHRYAGKARRFQQTLAAGSMLMHRGSAQALGFTRRAAGINWPVGQRVQKAGGTIYAVHAYDMVTLKRGYTPADFPPDSVLTSAAPFAWPSTPADRYTSHNS